MSEDESESDLLHLLMNRPTETDNSRAGAKLDGLLRKSKYSSRTSFANTPSKAPASREYFSQPYESNEMLFPFFALPVEMRLLVYHELLVSDDRFVLTWRGPQKVQKQQKKIYIGILQASKLCSIEGLAVLYGENVFDFENIRQRPSIADPILSRIGTTNPTLIRCIVAEHSAADEELTRTDGLLYEDRPHLVHYLRFSLDAFNISLDQLRVFAISIIPFGYDSSTTDIMRMKAPDLLEGSQLTLARVAWLDRRNARLNEVVDDICTREKNLRKVDYFKDVHSKISFDWSTPFAGRHWIAYKKS